MMVSAAPAYLSDEDVVRLRWPYSSSPALTSSDVETRGIASGNAVTGDARIQMVTEWVASHLDPLRTLLPNWDSYGGRPMTVRALGAAERLSAALLLEAAPWHSFVPRPDGGVTLVWNRPHAEFSIELPATDDPVADGSAFFVDETSGEEWEDHLNLEDPRFGDALRRLMA